MHFAILGTFGLAGTLGQAKLNAMRLKFHGVQTACYSRILSCILLIHAIGCAGGQSGNEGELPVPPCAAQGALVAGRISTLGAGCVTLEVLWVAKDGVPVTNAEGRELFSGNANPGDALRGKLGQIYSYSHSFEEGDTVAALPILWGDHLELQLMPLDDEEVEVQWGAAQFRTALDDLASPTCEAIMQANAASADHDDGAPRATAQAPEVIDPACGN